MISDMPKPRPPYLVREISRGQTYWYVRKGRHGARVRIRGEYGSDEFWTNYRAALEGCAAPRPTKTADGSLAWLIQRYRETSHWLGLSPATRKQRECIYRQVIEKSGDVAAARIDRAAIVRGRENRAATPAQARNFLDAMRGLFRWAHDSGLVPADPTEGVKNPRRPKGLGFEPWTEDDVVAYRTKWPIGTKERVWLEVLLHTGLRRGDAARIGRQHVRDGEATIRTEKTGMEVTIPLGDDFLAAVEAGPTGDLFFICGERGQPLTKESFGNMFRSACTAAGVRKSAHGVRKLAATRIAEAGASVAELEALFGWQGGAMASLYTKAANRKCLSRRAMERMRAETAPSAAGAAPSARNKR